LGYRSRTHNCYSALLLLDMKSLIQIIYSVIIVCAIASCGTVSQSVQNNSGGGWYTVKKTDTLYSIAWRYGLDYHQLARWNHIGQDFIIHPGQRLILVKPKNTTLLAKNKEASKSTKKAGQTTQKKPVKPVKIENTVVKWRWPSSGKIINTYAPNKLDRKGIDIAGKLGQSVHAVANGKVVYSGNGLAGYGNLIIIKHNDTYLSAYAYNQQRLVKEGMTVKAGMVISKMGQHPDGSTRLHFEIRKNGKPVDPLKYLPRL
jgi:lipoprotein NlpD